MTKKSPGAKKKPSPWYNYARGCADLNLGEVAWQGHVEQYYDNEWGASIRDWTDIGFFKTKEAAQKAVEKWLLKQLRKEQKAISKALAKLEVRH